MVMKIAKGEECGGNKIKIVNQSLLPSYRDWNIASLMIIHIYPLP